MSIDAENTTVIQGGGSPKAIEGRAEQIRQEIEVTDSEYDREKRVGDDACPCDTGALAALRDWAGDSGLAIQPAPGMAGIAHPTGCCRAV